MSDIVWLFLIAQSSYFLALLHWFLKHDTTLNLKIVIISADNLPSYKDVLKL